MISTKRLASALAVLAAVILLGMFFYGDKASANVITQGVIPQVATSSLMSVGPQNAVTLFAKASNCTARIISTGANPIMLSFSSVLAPAAQVGHYQAASTTVSYDNAVYGCGQVSAYGYSASTSITVTGLTQY